MMEAVQRVVAAVQAEPRFFALLFSSLCFAFFIASHFLFGEDIAPVRFSVPTPVLPDDGKQDVKEKNTDLTEVRDGKIFPRCPADGRRLTANPIVPATHAEIDDAIARAAKAQKEWAKTSFGARRKLLNTILQHVLDNQDSIIQVACLDSGKTKIDASLGEILTTVEKLQWTIKYGEEALAPSKRSTNLLMCYKNNYVAYEPLGVVASCFSWNYPFHSFISLVISGFFTGNAVLLKPSEQTCWSSFYYLEIVRAALRTLGHDEDLIQNVVCLPEAADYLTSHPGISHITFIGSRSVAHHVCRSAAKSLTPVVVELGGKDAAIVLDDKATVASVDNIIPILMRGTFQSAGQNCIGIERVIALPRIHDIIIEKMKTKIATLRMGSITLVQTQQGDIDMGSMISPASFDRLEKLITSAVAAGATLHAGGSRHQHPDFPHGHYFQPTLISGVTRDMEIAQTELFGPICTIMRAENTDHAIELANGTLYGLGASCFASPISANVKVLNRIAREIKSGMVSINDFGSYYVCSLPFGGTSGSGYGRFGGPEGLQGLCNPKSICEDAWWARLLGIQTAIPPVLQYPVKARNGYQACQGIVETGYSPSWTGMVTGVVKLLGGLLGR